MSSSGLTPIAIGCGPQHGDAAPVSTPRTLSVVMPAHNEADSIGPVLRLLCETLAREAVPYEIVVVDDHSTDETPGAVAAVSRDFPPVRLIENPASGGFGLAVRAGLDA